MAPYPTTNTVYRGVDGVITKTTVPLPELKPNEVLVKITHSGLCYTDVLYVPAGPVLGHEGVGIVEAIGSDVKQFKIGDRAGGGYHRGSCGHCKYCLTGQDIWCYERAIYGETDFQNGTFAEYYIGKETYLHRIPDGLPSELAAPLQCAGATTYGGLVSVLKPGDRVGVYGIGGLGHLAIQFASKLGAEVVVFSTSHGKEEAARGYGASEFVLVDEPEKISKPIDILVVAGSKYPDWSKYLVKNVLARQGKILNFSAPAHAPDGQIKIPAWPAFFDGYNLVSSLVASRATHDDMLDFAARNKIIPQIEKFDVSDVNLKGMADRLSGVGKGVRYRGVAVFPQ